jgi:hypothetical protein
MAEQNTVIRLYEHYDYITHKRLWTDLAVLVNGNKDSLSTDEYLWYHPFEQEERQATDTDKKIAKEDRQLRVKRTQYVNFMKMARNRLVSLLMKGGLNTSEVEKIFEPNINDVDGGQHSLEEFLIQVVEHVITFGVAYVLTNTRTQNVASLKEQLDKNIRPFLILIHPLDFKDWQNGANGEYNIYRYEYLTTELRPDLNSCPVLAKYCEVTKLVTDKETKKVVTSIYVSINKTSEIINYHPQATEQKDKMHYNWQFKQDIEHDAKLQELPLSTNKIQESWLSDAAPIALKIYNKQSEKDNVLYNNGYDKIFVFGDLESAVDEAGNEISEENKTKKISHNSLCILPEAARVDKLVPTDLTSFKDAIEEDVMNFFQVVFNQLRVLPTDSRQAESAENIEEQKEALLTRISNKRKELENLFNSIVKHWAFFKNTQQKIKETQKITFKQPLTLSDIDDLAVFVRMIENRVRRYPTWDKAIDKLFLANLEAIPNKQEILDEIEATDLEQLQQDEMQNFTSTLQKGFGQKPSAGNQKPSEKSPQVAKKRSSAQNK